VRLKPTFWKLREQARVHSGWLKPDDSEKGYSELWVTPQTALRAACSLVRVDPQLTCSIIETATALRPETTIHGKITDILTLPLDKLDVVLTLKPADRIVYSKRLDMTPFTVIEAGEQGIVDFTCARNGTVDIRLEHYHRGLADFDNCAWLVPNTTEEWLDAVELV
jgi:hypothetical protein